jgi:pilus assembly protein FimV
MAENIPGGPAGAVPPKKETGKVQPKKETVRINLPPKPSAAPTIKLPTLPPGGPGAGAPAAPMSAAAAAPAHAPGPARPGAAAPAMAAAPRPAPAAVPRPAPVAVHAGPTVSAVDMALAIIAAVAGLVAVGSTLYLMLGLPNLQ